MPSTQEMADPSNWAHYTLNILDVCRTAHLDPEVPDGEEIDPEDLKKQIEAKDPYEARLKPIT